MNLMTKTIASLGLAATTILGAQSASAAVIKSGNLDFSGRMNPDIQFNALDFSFDAGTGDFNISSPFAGSNNTNLNGDEHFKSGWMFEIDGDYDSGQLINTTLSISNGNSRNMLSGDLAQFSLAGPGVFNFMFEDLKGSRASKFGDFAGVIFSDISLPQDFDFSSSYSSTFMGNANTFKNATNVSEPGTLVLSLLGLTTLIARRRKSQDK